MPPALSDLESLARSAGEILREYYGQPIRVDYKDAINPVTEADHRSEAFLLSEIRRRFPEHSILAEESGEFSGQACCTWYIDPLDGTVNYAHGVPIFAVSIAYAEDGIVRLGVVYDPMQDECFMGERGAGAWLNGRSIRASETALLDKSLLVTGFPYDIRTNPDNNLDWFAYFSLRTQAVRRLGSAALDLCYVGCGRFEGFWELRLSPWDLAAGGLIAAEAGAIVTGLDGGPDYLSPPCSILAGNRYIHPHMLSAFKEKA